MLLKYKIFWLLRAFEDFWRSQIWTSWSMHLFLLAVMFYVTCKASGKILAQLTVVLYFIRSVIHIWVYTMWSRILQWPGRTRKVTAKYWTLFTIVCYEQNSEFWCWFRLFFSQLLTIIYTVYPVRAVTKKFLDGSTGHSFHNSCSITSCSPFTNSLRSEKIQLYVVHILFSSIIISCVADTIF